jgi:hypothetical protein
LSKKHLVITLIALLIGVLFFEFQAVNSMVSLRYETDGPDDCISVITGIDLCLSVKTFHFLAILCGGLFLVVLIVKQKSL